MLSLRSYGFLITKTLIFCFQILDLKVHFSASLNSMIVNIFQADFGSRRTLLGKVLFDVQGYPHSAAPPAMYEVMLAFSLLF